MEYSLTRSRTYAPPPGLGPRSWIWRKGEAPQISPQKWVPYSGFTQLLQVSSDKLIGHPWTPVQVAYLMTGGLVKGILDPSLSGLWSLLGAHIHLRCRLEVEPRNRWKSNDTQCIKERGGFKHHKRKHGIKTIQSSRIWQEDKCKTWNHTTENHLAMASSTTIWLLLFLNGTKTGKNTLTAQPVWGIPKSGSTSTNRIAAR